MRKNTISWIKSTAGKLNKLYFLLILTSAIQSALMIWFALAVKDLINCAIYNSPTLNAIVKNSVITCSLVVSAYLFSLLNKLLMEKCRTTADINIKKNVFRKLLKKDYASISSYKSGDILNRVINDSSVIASGYASILPNLVSMVTKIALAVGVLVFLQPLFSLFLAIGGLIIILFSLFLRKTLKKLYKKTKEASSDVMAYYSETTSNLLAVKVFSCEEKFSKNCDRVTEKYGKTVKKQRYISSALTTGIGLCFTMFYLLTVIWGAIGLYNGTQGVDFGMITAMIQLISQLQAPFANITGLFSVYYEMIASAERIIELENLKEEITPDSSIDFDELYRNLSSIDFENVSFAYDREKVLDEANLTIKKGDVLMIKGISGIGKSTLMKLMLGVYESFQGEISLNLKGEKLPLTSEYRNLFAYVPQGNLLFSGTIRENVCFLNERATEEDITNAIKVARMDFVNEFPDGLDTKIGEKGLGLSEGQSQRVAIARAVLSKRPILLFDEATSALDEQTEFEILQNIKYISEGYHTCIFISHKTAAKNICNGAVRIADGKIILD